MDSNEIISEAYNYSEKLYNGMNTLINNIDSRNLENIEEYFKNILEGFNWLLEVAISIKNSNEIELDIDNIYGKVKSFVEAYNNIDILLVRDIVQYELMPQVEVFYNIYNEALGIMQNSN